ncbi:hypothetical protein ACFQO4_17270 [Saliphagus sp. GCM10025334]
MSSNSDEEVPGREVAYRVFAAEFDDADYSHAESDEERAPNYVITPTGARLNRVFVVGALTEITAVNDEMLRARVVDPTGAFVVYAGQYQPDELAFLERIDPPAFVAVTGKARTFQPDDSDVVYTSIRPESIATVDPETRDRWVVSAAEQTLERVGTYAAAADLEASGAALETALREAGVERGLAAGIPLAQGHYGTTPAYLEGVRDLALDAAAVVAGDRDEVRGLDRQPSDSQPGTPSFAALASAESIDLDVDVDVDDDLEDAATRDETELEAPAAAESTDSAVTTDTGTESTGLEVDDASGGDELGDFDAGESDSTADELGDFDAGVEAEDEVATAEESGSTADEESVDEESVDVGQNGDLEEDELEDASGMYEMDDEEREQLEAEFGTEFSTGADVDEPGEADIDVPAGDESVEDVEDDEDDEDDEVEPAVDEEESAEAAEESNEIDESNGEEESEEADEAEGDDEDEEGDDEETDLEDVDLQDLVVETMTDLDDGEGADRSAVIDTVTDETGADEDDVEEAIDDALMGGQCYEPGDGKLKAI